MSQQSSFLRQARRRRDQTSNSTNGHLAFRTNSDAIPPFVGMTNFPNTLVGNHLFDFKKVQKFPLSWKNHRQSLSLIISTAFGKGVEKN